MHYQIIDSLLIFLLNIV